MNWRVCVLNSQWLFCRRKTVNKWHYIWFEALNIFYLPSFYPSILYAFLNDIFVKLVLITFSFVNLQILHRLMFINKYDYLFKLVEIWICTSEILNTLNRFSTTVLSTCQHMQMDFVYRKTGYKGKFSRFPMYKCK